MSLTVKSQPGTAKMRFSISSSNTPIALQYDSSVLRPKQMLCTVYSNNSILFWRFQHVLVFVHVYATMQALRVSVCKAFCNSVCCILIYLVIIVMYSAQWRRASVDSVTVDMTCVWCIVCRVILDVTVIPDVQVVLETTATVVVMERPDARDNLERRYAPPHHFHPTFESWPATLVFLFVCPAMSFILTSVLDVCFASLSWPYLGQSWGSRS